jgi:hypothetical protein
MTDDSDLGTRAGQQGGSSWSSILPVLVPALTFLVGIALGAGVLLLSDTGDDGDAEPTSPTSPAETGGAGDTVVVVPAACEEAAANLTEATQLLDDVAGSIRDFRPNELVDLLNELEALDQETRSLASECSSDVEVTEGPGESATVTGEPEETGNAEESESP